MWTKDKLESFMKNYGFKPNLTKPEIKELPEILHPEEKLLGLVEGLLKKIHNREISGHGLVIATNKRVIFFRKSFIGTVTKEETPISKISSASFRKGFLTSSIAIVTSNNESEVDNCDKILGKKFIDIVQNLISELDQITNSPNNVQSIQESSVSQLEKLFELKQKGILTDDEFNTQKIKILSQ